MKIVHVVENMDDSYGGPAKSIPLLCKYLHVLGVQTLILSVGFKENENNTVIEKNALNWESFKYVYLKKLRISLKLRDRLEELAKQKGTIFHIHNSWNYIPYITKKICKKYKRPYVVSVRGSMYPWSLNQSKWVKKIAWYIFQKATLENASFIHSTEENETNALRKLRIKNNIEIVPNGIELLEPRPIINKDESLERLSLQKNRRYILFLSRIHPKKGLEYLIDAFASSAGNNNDWELLVAGPVGDDKYYAEILDSIKKKGITNKVHFLGLIENEKKEAAFSVSELFVLPSHTENFGIAIAEAISCDIPVITTKGTPWKEIEVHKSGWYIDLSIKSLTSALDEAMSMDDEILQLMGLNGRKFIKNYDWEIQAEKMLKLYNGIIKN